ncbi:hypothetical protein APHAL10511_005193 [Amanita phalloides]|nr:hypothetical protein APHAL10511_005193 [Amanita phalloides]
MPEMPIEVLQHIFLHTLQGPLSNVQECLFPWDIGGVCKAWRYAFVTHARLWASITLDAGVVSHVPSLERLFHRFMLCLERSGNYPLNVSLYIPPIVLEDDVPWIDSIWCAFLSCSHRWRKIILLGPISPILWNGDMPMLESFVLSTRYLMSRGGGGHYRHLPVFSPDELDAHNWSLPWSQVTTIALDIYLVLGEKLPTLLQSLQRIAELRFMVHNFQAETPVYVSAPKCLNHLRILEVPYPQILEIIEAPCLYELHLKTSYDIYPVDDDGNELFGWYRELVDGFMQRSSCRIRRVTLEGFDAILAKPLVSAFPHLKELCFDESSDYRSIDILQFNPDSDAVAFPNLRNLSLTCYPFEVESKIDSLANILASRNRADSQVSRLEKLVILLKQKLSILPCPLEPLPIPPAFERILPEWAHFQVDIQFEQL